MKRLTFLLKGMKDRMGLAPMALGCFALGVFCLYMWQLSVSTSAGYTMRQVENEISQLKADIAAKQMHIAKLKSIDSVSGRIQLLGMVKPQEVAYVFTTSGSVAINR